LADDERDAPAAKKKRKKKRRRKRKRAAEEAPKRESGEKGSELEGGEQALRMERREPEGDEKGEESPSGRGRYVWLALLAVGLFELWLFGRRGHIEVCVAKEGVHDFALLGQKRTDENTRRFPTCEKRLNLGITSSFDDAREEAMLRACHRANILRGKQATLVCAIEEDGWQHRLTVEHCPPWHDHYYQRMLWFLY
jgi:hypothetical protein